MLDVHDPSAGMDELDEQYVPPQLADAAVANVVVASMIAALFKIRETITPPFIMIRLARLFVFKSKRRAKTK